MHRQIRIMVGDIGYDIDVDVVKSHRPNDPRPPHSYHTYCIMTYICNDIIVSSDEVPDGALMVE